MSDDKNKWKRPDSPPPPLFTGEKERDFVKQITDEIIERIMPQRILYYPISIEHTNFHSIYGEAIQKIFYDPIEVPCIITWEGSETTINNYGVDKESTIKIHFPKRRISEDRNLFVRVGDFVNYGSFYYEIMTLSEPRELFGQTQYKIEIIASCKRARRGLFDAS